MGTPFVVLKPTATSCAGSIWRPGKGLYLPTPSRLSALLADWPTAQRGQRLELAECERYAREYEVNILGACFLAGLAHMDATIRYLFTAEVTADRAHVLAPLYPDL